MARDCGDGSAKLRELLASLPCLTHRERPVTSEPARQLLLQYFPGTDPTWLAGEAWGERRVDAFVVGSGPDARPYHVASLLIDGSFVPDVVSEYPHIPYDTAQVNAKPPRGAEPGVFVTTTAVHPPTATQARFVQRGARRVASVVGGHCALFDWDAGWLPAADRPRPNALLVEGAWVPTVSPSVAATCEAFRRAYAAYYDAGGQGDDWAVMAFFEDGSFAEKVQMVECVLGDDGLSPLGLGCLSAGPVENLIGHDLLDYIERDADTRARWVPLLRGTYWHSEPPDVRERLGALLGVDVPLPMPKRR